MHIYKKFRKKKTKKEFPENWEQSIVLSWKKLTFFFHFEFMCKFFHFPFQIKFFSFDKISSALTFLLLHMNDFFQRGNAFSNVSPFRLKKNAPVSFQKKFLSNRFFEYFFSVSLINIFNNFKAIQKFSIGIRAKSLKKREWILQQDNK